MDNVVSNYIGNNGYTIRKDCLEQGDIKVIKNDLTVRPYIPSSPIQAPSFPVYRETEHTPIAENVGLSRGTMKSIKSSQRRNLREQLINELGPAYRYLRLV